VGLGVPELNYIKKGVFYVIVNLSNHAGNLYPKAMRPASISGNCYVPPVLESRCADLVSQALQTSSGMVTIYARTRYRLTLIVVSPSGASNPDLHAVALANANREVSKKEVKA